jgi:hypothetical protein
MRRVEIVDAIKQIRKALDESKLQEALLTYVKRATGKETPKEPIEGLLQSLKSYSIRANDFSLAARELSDIFSLTRFEDPAYWASLVVAQGRMSVSRSLEIINFAARFLPKVAAMIQQEHLQAVTESSENETKSFADKGLLSIVVIEDKNRFSSPTRLIEVLQSVSDLYEACAIRQGMSANDLSVIACDSGSDKSFDFLGAAKVIECVKEIILSLWDRIVFFREKQLSQRIDLISEALPIIEQIGNLERENKLGREQAEILRRKILGGVSKFIESGAMIPEIEDRTHFNPRSLMAPEPKLLVGAQEDASQGVVQNEDYGGESHRDEDASTESTVEDIDDYED